MSLLHQTTVLASGYYPNGLRIMDQLGVLEAFEKQSSPLERSYHIDDKGEPILAHDGMSHYFSKEVLIIYIF